MILDKDEKIIQVFDLYIEGAISEYKNPDNPEKSHPILGEKMTSIYESYKLPPNYERRTVPWSVSQEERKKRVDEFVNGGQPIINGVKIDYGFNGQGFMYKYKDTQFKEMFKETLIEESANIDYDEELSGGASAISKSTIIYKQI